MERHSFRMFSRLLHFALGLLLAAACLLTPAPADAQSSCTNSLSYVEINNGPAQSGTCSGRVCKKPEFGAVTVDLAGCDPKVANCAATVSAALNFPGRHQNPTNDGFPYNQVEVPGVGICGLVGAVLKKDLGTASFNTSISCQAYAQSPAAFQFTLIARGCPGYPHRSRFAKRPRPRPSTSVSLPVASRIRPWTHAINVKRRRLRA